MLSNEIKDCIFKSMRKSPQIPVELIPVMLLLIFGILRTHAQNETNSTDLLLATLPELFVGENGTLISEASDWEQIRRDEILDLFTDHVYGRVPDSDVFITHHVKFMDRNALGGKAVMKEVELEVSNGSESMGITMLIYLPRESKGPAPLFLGLNFHGNHTIHSDPQITVKDNWVINSNAIGVTEHSADERFRGVRALRWPVDLILSRGYGVATICCADIDPDFDDGFKNGIHALMDSQGETREKEAWLHGRGDCPGPWTILRKMKISTTEGLL